MWSYFFLFLFFFFKQKTAYEMRISDWSSDVCSSDLYVPYAPWTPPPPGRSMETSPQENTSPEDPTVFASQKGTHHEHRVRHEIGRASCREKCVSTCRSRWSPYH